MVLGGEKRHVVVLFVDIRGFTTMSESLEPEQVVEQVCRNWHRQKTEHGTSTFPKQLQRILR